MKTAIYWLFVIMFFCSCSKFDFESESLSTEEEAVDSGPPSKEDLDARYKAQWDKAEYHVARTADTEDYLEKEEQEIFYYLNLMRLNPPLFAQTYATGYDGAKGWSKGYAWDERKDSLIADLSIMEPLPLLYPDVKLYELARCFATEGGKLGITGHDRSQTGCATGYKAECCQYGGARNGLAIIMAFLIDAGENNAELGHRAILFTSDYVKLGVSIQPHIKYNINAVLDFGK
jgi:hypothetical protein